MGETRFIVRCSAVVETSGYVSDSVCYDAIGSGAATLGYWDLKRLTRGIKRAITKMQAVPARINGKPRKVWMNYGVEFVRHNSTSSVHVHEYFVFDADSLRPDFVGAQRTLSDSNLWSLHCLAENSKMFWVVAKLDAQGKPESMRVRPEDLSNRCVSGLNRAIEGSNFTPALANGRPVLEVYYVEPFYYSGPRFAFN